RAPPGVAVQGKGRPVIAWVDSQGRLMLRRADPGAPFGTSQLAQLRPAGQGTNVFRDGPAVVATGDGRAVVAIRTVEYRAGAVVDSRVEALDWRLAAARPYAAAAPCRRPPARPATPYATPPPPPPPPPTPARNGAVDAFYRAGGLRWFTVRLSAAGRYTGTTV